MIGAIALLLMAALDPGSVRSIAQAEAPPVEVWQLDQIRLPPDTDEKVVAALGPAHSMDAVVAELKRRNVAFTRSRAVLLPDRLPDEVRAKILSLPPGEPFVLPEGRFISVSVILARKLPPNSVGWQPAPASFPRLPRKA